MSYILGIDLSTKAIDCALLDVDSDRAEFRRYEIVAPDAFQAARRVRDAMPSRWTWQDEGVILIATESLWSHSRGTLKVLSRIQGAVLTCLPPQLDVLELSPTEWRLNSIAIQNASKGHVRAWAINQASERYPTAVGMATVTVDLTHDQADAYCIAYAARKLCEEAAA